jgi:uncharacterized membrane protein
MNPLQMLRSSIEFAGYLIETIGVGVILIGVTLALLRYAHHFRQLGSDDAYEQLRRGLGRSIIVGLEFLIAGDIVRTVVVEQSIESLGFLSIIVLIRILLSFSLFVEVEGRWPWQAVRPPLDRSPDAAQRNPGSPAPP